MPRKKPADEIPRLLKRGVNPVRPLQIAEVRAVGRDTGTLAAIALIDEDKPLTGLQRLFVKNWAQGESIQTAAYRAGYTDKGAFAYRLVHFPNIKKLYAQEKRKYEEASQMTRKKVMDGLLEGVEMAKMAGEPASMIAGWREIGKMCGYYEPVKHRVEVSVNGSIALDRMNRLSDAELLKLISEGVPEIAETLLVENGSEAEVDG